MRIIYTATTDVRRTKASIESLLRSINHSKVACTGYFINASDKEVGEYLIDGKIMSNAIPMRSMIYGQFSKGTPINEMVINAIEWCEKNDKVPSHYLIVHAPIMFATTAINELANLALSDPMIDTICCKRIKTNEPITQERLDKLAKVSLTLSPMVGFDMPMLRKAAGAKQNPRGNTSVICQKSVCKEVI